AERLGVPVYRVDEAMADEAVRAGERISVIATLPTTVQPTAALLRERAELQGRDVQIDEVVVPGAFEAAIAGDRARHDSPVAPACVPARTSLLTGRFPSAHQVRQNSNAQYAHYQQDLLDVLRDADYQLHFAGKPHMHRGPDDFDTYAGPYFHTEGPERNADEK